MLGEALVSRLAVTLKSKISYVSKQQQEVSEGGQALQAGGNIVVNNGMSADQMSEIIVSLTKQILALNNEAKLEQENRFGELKDALLLEFAKPESKANAEAFSDPDFQYVVRDAHEAYARRGDADLKVELVNLISERSAHQAKTRVAQTLNSAIELAGKLSREEYAALVMLFTMQNVVVNGAHIDIILNTTDNLLAPFVSDLPTDGYSVQYLQSLGCVSINQIVTNPLSGILVSKYAHAVGTGFTHDELSTACGDDATLARVVPLTVANFDKPTTFQQVSASTAFRFMKGTEADLSAALEQNGVDPDAKQRLLSLHNSRMANEQEVMSIFRAKSKYASALEEFWAIKETQQASVNIVGQALAHSALVSKGSMSAPLDIWVR